MADHHAGMIVDDGAEDGFGKPAGGVDLGTVHEVAHPKLVYVIDLEGLAHIPSFPDGKPSLLFDQPEKGIVVDGRIPQQSLVLQILVKELSRPVRIGITLDPDGLDHFPVQSPGSATVRSLPGFKGLEPTFAISPKPSLQGGDTDLFPPIPGKVMNPLGLFSEVVVLRPPRLGKHGADELIARQSDPFPNVLFHRCVLLHNVFG